LGFSPCPNDTFIFDALVHGKIDTECLEFEVIMKDVEELNQMAFRKELDITKLSYHAFAHLTNDYVLLNAGSALGRNCGPLFISKNQHPISGIQHLRIAIPGKYTTANFLLLLAFPEAKNKVEMLFSEIEEAVLSGKVDAGVIIHENRFTYEQKGLKKIMDLGEWWEKETDMPIPLGGIAVKRDLSIEIQQKINRVLKRSVQFAFENPKSSYAFMHKHAQEMDKKVMYQHVDLYVNDFTLDLGEEGKRAVKLLFEKAVENGMTSKMKSDIFVC